MKVDLARCGGGWGKEEWGGEGRPSPLPPGSAAGARNERRLALLDPRGGVYASPRGLTLGKVPAPSLGAAFSERARTGDCLPRTEGEGSVRVNALISAWECTSAWERTALLRDWTAYQRRVSAWKECTSACERTAHLRDWIGLNDLAWPRCSTQVLGRGGWPGGRIGSEGTWPGGRARSSSWPTGYGYRDGPSPSAPANSGLLGRPR